MITFGVVTRIRIMAEEKIKQNVRNTRKQEYHDKNIELCRTMIDEYANSTMTWENIYRMYDVSNVTFNRWIKAYGLTEERNNATIKAKTAHRVKISKPVNEKILQDLKSVCEIYGNEPVTWRQACEKHGVNYNTFNDNKRRYFPMVEHLFEQANIAHQKNKIARVQEYADAGVEMAMEALVEKLQKRTIKEVQKKTTEKKVGRRKIKNETTINKVKEVDADMAAITTMLKMAGLLSDQQQIIVQNQIDIIGQKAPLELEYDMKSDLERLKELGVEDVDFEEDF